MKVKNRNIRKRCGIISKLTVITPKRRFFYLTRIYQYIDKIEHLPVQIYLIRETGQRKWRFLMSLSLTVDIFHTFICFFYYLLWLHFLGRDYTATYHSYSVPILREKCPNTEFFLVRLFLHLDWIWIFTP